MVQTEDLALNPHPVPGTEVLAQSAGGGEAPASLCSIFLSALGWSVYLLTGPGAPETQSSIHSFMNVALVPNTAGAQSAEIE